MEWSDTDIAVPPSTGETSTGHRAPQKNSGILLQRLHFNLWRSMPSTDKTYSRSRWTTLRAHLWSRLTSSLTCSTNINNHVITWHQSDNITTSNVHTEKQHVRSASALVAITVTLLRHSANIHRTEQQCYKTQSDLDPKFWHCCSDDRKNFCISNP